MMEDNKSLPVNPWDAFPADTAHPPSAALPNTPWEAFGAPPPEASGDSNLKDPDWISKLYHPVITGTAQTVGALGSAALAAPSGPIGAGLAGMAGGAAMYGPGNNAANAIDAMRGMQSPAPSGGILSDLGTGAEVEAGGKVLGAAIKAAEPVAKDAIIKGISTVFGPSKEAIEAWLENPSLPNSPDFVALARKMPQTLSKLKDRISAASDNADSLLNNSTDPDEGAIPSSKITGMIQDLADKLKNNGVLIGSQDKGAASQLNALMADVGKILKPEQPNFQIVDQSGKVIPWTAPDAMLPETVVKGILKSARKNINWDDAGASATNSALTSFSGDLDRILKNGNPDYAQAMKPVSKMMGTLENVQDSFGITHRTGQGLQPSDSTISKLQSVLNDKKSISQDTLNDLKQMTGDDYLKDSQNAKYAAEFQKSATQGSRRVVLGGSLGAGAGAAIGGILGHPVIGAQAGEVVGGAAGAVVDKFGGPIAASLIKKGMPIKEVLETLSQSMPMEIAERAVSAAIGQNSGAQ